MGEGFFFSLTGQHIKFKFILFIAQNYSRPGITSGVVVTASFLRPLNRVRKNLKREKNMGSLSSCWKEPQTGSIRFCRKGCISTIRIGACFPARLRLRGVSQKSLWGLEFQETVSPKTPVRERRRPDQRVSSVKPTAVGQGPVNPSKSASFLLSDIWKLWQPKGQYMKNCII